MTQPGGLVPPCKSPNAFVRICILWCTMTAPPLPASPCLRVKLDYTNADSYRGGNRFFLSYSGTAPTAAQCVTIANDIATAWNGNIAALVHSDWGLSEVDVQDISSLTGAFGTQAVDYVGTYTGSLLPASAATNVEFDISRRYRGGKPRIFWPPPSSSALLDAGHWSTAFITAVTSGNAAFWAAVAAISVGTVGTLAHVNLSYYTGFKNITNSSGRTRAVPQYRDSALLDTITGYAIKDEVGSQRRRRIATTP